MKALVFCACVLALASFSSTESLKEALKSAISNIEDDYLTCKNENDATSEELYEEEQIIAEMYKEPGQEERVRKNGCTAACIFKKQDFMEGSNFNEVKVHVAIDKELRGQPERNIAKVHKIARDCMKEVKDITEECEKGFSTLVCVMKKVHKMWRHKDHEQDEEHNEGHNEEHNEETDNN